LEKNLPKNSVRFFILFLKPKVNNHPIGENSPNPVTLADYQFQLQRISFIAKRFRKKPNCEQFSETVFLKVKNYPTARLKLYPKAMPF
jgi:hypothetical protein